MAAQVDFGNGIVTGTNAILVEHSGLEYPEVEVSANENAIIDGGTVNSTHVRTRRMTVKLFFPPGTSRSSVAAAFTPRTLRTMSTSVASIGYYVEGLDFEETNRRKPPVAVVTMVSDQAYPTSDPLTEAPDVSHHLTSHCEVHTPGVFTVTVPAGFTETTKVFTLSTPAGTTAVTWDTNWSVADVIVVDSEDFTVTIEGADALEFFDRASPWPRLDPGQNTVWAKFGDTYGTVSVTWSPRLVGILEDSTVDFGASLVTVGQTYAIDDCLALESNLAAPSTGTAPSRSKYDGPSNTGDWSLWEFPDNVTRYLQSSVQLPHGYVRDSPLLWHVHFIPNGSITDGQTVKFIAEITYASVYGTFTTEQEYTTTFTSSGTSAIDKHCMTASVSIQPVALGGSGFVLARIRRDTTDTATVGVWLLGSDYHIRVNRLGSVSEDPNS